MPRRRLLPVAILAALIAGACQLSLAGDIQPPTGSELGQTTVTPVPLVYPAAAPDPEFGGLIFAQSCAPCHGERGLGDGAQSSALPVEVPAIGDSDLSAGKSPADWYLMVSQGNLDNYMPPFAGSLTVQERWDVLAYVFSLSQDEELLQTGQLLAIELEMEAADLAAVAPATQAELAGQLASDMGLSAADGAALAAYLQASALGWAAPDAVADLVIEEAQATEESDTDAGAEGGAPAEESGAVDAIVMQGAVSNGSGGEIPMGAEVLLRGFDQSSEVFSLSTELGEDGRYRFEAVDLDPALVYATTIDYEGLIYFSEAVQFDGTQTEFELPLTIYEITNDTSSLVIDRLQMVFQFGEEGFVRVIQLVSITNNGSEAVTPSSDTEPALLFSLPPEASNLAFESGAIGDRYIPTDGGFGDLRAVLPGSGAYQMLYAYELPYGSRLDYSQDLHLPVASANLFVPAGALEVRSADFLVLGDQQIDGEAFTGYQSAGEYAVGDTIDFELRGSHPLGGGNWLVDLAAQSDVLTGLVALTAVVAVAWFWLRRQNASGPDPDEIMDAIIALDARYADDEIADDVYLKRRAALKERLRRTLETPRARPK